MKKIKKFMLVGISVVAFSQAIMAREAIQETKAEEVISNKEESEEKILEGTILEQEPELGNTQLMHIISNYIEREMITLPFYDSVWLDYIKSSDMKVVLDEKAYPLYRLHDTNYITIEDLEKMGFDVKEVEGEVYIVQDKNKPIIATQDKPMSGTHVGSMYSKKVHMGNLLTYSIRVGDQIMIPLRGLSDYYALDISGDTCNLRAKDNSSQAFIRVEGQRVTNMSEEVLTVQLTQLFFDGTEVIEDVMTIENLAPGTSCELGVPTALDTPQMIHISTAVNKVGQVNEEGQLVYAIQMSTESYGQDNLQLLNLYQVNKSLLSPEGLQTLFPASIITGTMKYDTSGLKKGEKVEVWAAEDGYCYYVYKNGKKIEVPWGSVSIPSNPATCETQATKLQLEMYINAKGMTSPTNYLVWTDLYRQRTYVFERVDGQWQLLKNLVCTTGNNKTPTPRGQFALQANVPYFGINKGYRCQDAKQIFGDYLYHSVMLDKSGSYVLKSNGPLGRRASHGCIRLSVEDANWFYNTIPLKTTVWIN